MLGEGAAPLVAAVRPAHEAVAPEWPVMKAAGDAGDTMVREAIDAELVAIQGSPVDLGGYYRPDAAKTTAVMRPSEAFNQIIAEV